MVVCSVSLFDVIVESFGDSWLKEFAPGAKKNLVQVSTICLTSVYSMMLLIRSYCKTGTPADNHWVTLLLRELLLTDHPSCGRAVTVAFIYNTVVI